MTEAKKPQPKKPAFEPLAPIGIFLMVFGVIITYATVYPTQFADKMVNLISGIAFLVWGGAWFYVGWKRIKKLKEQQRKDEKL